MFRLVPFRFALIAAFSSSAALAWTTSCSGDSEGGGGEGGRGQSGGTNSGGATTGGKPTSVAGAPSPSAGNAGSEGNAGNAGRQGNAGVPSNGGSAGAAGAVNSGAGLGGGVGMSAEGGEGGGGVAGLGGSGGTETSGASGGGGEPQTPLEKFSFFVTSMQAIATLSGTSLGEPAGFGFGGDLRFGKADGLSGADEICRQAAEFGMEGAGNKVWRAFLSTIGPPAVNARDRIGPGPWYDVLGRLVAANLNDLVGEGLVRPKADPEIVNDLPNERGEPNSYVGPNGYTAGKTWDNHDTLTGTDRSGNVAGQTKSDTCDDWTSTTAKSSTSGGLEWGRGTALPRIGHTFPRANATDYGAGWASDHGAPGCARGYYFASGDSAVSDDCVGCAGGYGAIYCFALR